MKKVLALNIFLTFCTFSQAQDMDIFLKSSDDFFKNYVIKNSVNYSSLKVNPQPLNQLILKIEKIQLSDNDLKNKAFYINAYNLLVISQINVHYPIESVMSVDGFFDQAKFKVAGKKLTLNQLENDVIRPKYKDPRLHFALVCGANGCPPIRNRAYGNNLDEELETQTRLAINNEQFIRLHSEEREVQISEIFNWYIEDFGGNNAGILEFINKYRVKDIPKSYKLKYYKYDWSLNLAKSNTQFEEEKEEKEEKKKQNLQTYTPSILMGAGQWEFKSFQNLYTQTGGYDNAQQFTDYGGRSTFFSSINQLTFGINGRINLGVDLWIKSVLNNGKEDSPLGLFQFQNSPQSRTELTGMGPKIRILPFKKLAHFSINSTFLIPVSKNLDGSEDSQKPWLSPDANIWITQFYYDQSLGNKFQLFLQLAPWYTIAKKGEAENKFEMPVDVYFSFFPSKRWTFYLQNGFWPAFNVEGKPTSYFMQGGIGGKYQLIPGLLELETSYTNFYYGWNSGAGQTFNFGVRLIRQRK